MIVAGADQERQTIDHDPLDESHLAFQPPGGRVLQPASGCRNPRRRGRGLVPSELELDRLIRDRHWPLDDHSHRLQQVSELGFRHAKGGIGAGWILGPPRGARAQDQYERYQYSGFGCREPGCLYIILHARYLIRFSISQ